MEGKQRKRLWSVVDRYLGEKKLVLHFSHIQRLCACFNLFKKDGVSLAPELIDAVECAILFHDIGCCVSIENHWWYSFQILRELFKKELSDIPNQEWILYAVANHSTGLAGAEAKDEKRLCLALLALFDHLDHLGAVGIIGNLLRFPKEWSFKTPFFPQKGSCFLRRIKYYFKNPKEVNNDQMEMRNTSILGYLVYQFGITFTILSSVKNLIGPTLREIIRKRLNETKVLIKDILGAETTIRL